MQIWIDADACPGVIKEILFRAAQRTGVQLTLVANQLLRVPAAANISMIQVPQGFDVADNEIVKRAGAGDLVITSDIPLAAEVVAQDALALNPRGELYTGENVGQLLDMRNFMDELRSSGVQTGGPAPLGNSDRRVFANQLDRLLARHTGR